MSGDAIPASLPPFKKITMKPLNKLSNVERAKLLFELFPEEMPKFRSFMIELTEAIITDPAKLKSKAIDQIHTTEFWQELVNTAQRRLGQYGKRLAKRSRLFSEQFFDGYDSIYAAYCLHQYIIKDEGLNRKFRNAVLLFFF
jgi:hypothetical protein